jgi:hypothetical protein
MKDLFLPFNSNTLKLYTNNSICGGKRGDVNECIWWFLSASDEELSVKNKEAIDDQILKWITIVHQNFLFLQPLWMISEAY